MYSISRMRYHIASMEVVVLWAILVGVSLHNAVFVVRTPVQSLATDPSVWAVYIVFYLVAIVLGAVARWANVFDSAAWRRSLGFD